MALTILRDLVLLCQYSRWSRVRQPLQCPPAQMQMQLTVDGSCFPLSYLQAAQHYRQTRRALRQRAAQLDATEAELHTLRRSFLQARSIVRREALALPSAAEREPIALPPLPGREPWPADLRLRFGF